MSQSKASKRRPQLNDWDVVEWVLLRNFPICAERQVGCLSDCTVCRTAL